MFVVPLANQRTTIDYSIALCHLLSEMGYGEYRIVTHQARLSGCGGGRILIVLLLTVYFILDTMIDKYFLMGNMKERTIISFAFQFAISSLSMLAGVYLIQIFLEIFERYSLFENYLSYLLSITSGELSVVAGNVLLQFVFTICIVSYLLYSSVFFFGKRHLIKIKVIKKDKLNRINELSVKGQLNSIYTILIFWIGFVPLFAETFGKDAFELDVKGFAIFTLLFAIPYTHINTAKFFSFRIRF